MTYLSNIPFFDHPLENWLFYIGIVVIAIAIWVFIFIRSRRKPPAPPRPKYDDEVNPWEAMARNNSDNVENKKK